MSSVTGHTPGEGENAAFSAAESPVPPFGRICAVIVTYNIGDSFVENFNSLKGQVDHAVIIDNGSGPDTLAMLSGLVGAHPEFVEVIHNTENNLARAQNIGIRRALTQKYDWVLLLDHDSRLGPGMAAAMKNVWVNAREREKIGIVAPHIRDRNAVREHAYLKSFFILFFRRVGFTPERGAIEGVMSVISSGSLIPLHVFEAVGMMDENFAIDYLDNDFCLRLIQRGFRIVVVRDAILYHSLGECRDHWLLGVHVTSTNHSPERRYFIYRNRITTWRRYAFSVPSFVVYDVLATLYDMIRILLFEDGKLAKFCRIASGLADALRGALGPRPALLR